MKILVVIPARMGSSRFPGKPMEQILGTPMIGHVYKNIAREEGAYSIDIAVATCDAVISDYIQSIGGLSVMTKDTHDRASDRCAEAMLFLEAKFGYKYDITVMVQGDEPMTTREMIDEALEPMITDSTIEILNLMADIRDENEFNDRNCIKVVCDQAENAIYFSREPIPTRNKGHHELAKKQVCVIPFRRSALLKFNDMKQTPLEIIESIDMLRFIENGVKIRMRKTNHESYSVDTEADLKKVELLLSIKR